MRRAVVGRHGAVELERRLRHEVEHGRRIHRHAQGLVRCRIHLGGGQAAQVREAVAHRLADADHELDVADAVLEAHQVGAALGERLQHRRAQPAHRAVVDDDAELHRPAHRLHVRGDAFRAGLGEVVRQQQDAVRAEPLGLLRIRDCLARGAARARDDRHLAAAGIDGGLDHLAVLAAGQREELARAAGGEQRAGAIGGEPLEARRVGASVEVALRVEIGDGERQQAGGDDLFEVLGRHERLAGKEGTWGRFSRAALPLRPRPWPSGCARW